MRRPRDPGSVRSWDSLNVSWGPGDGPVGSDDARCRQWITAGPLGECNKPGVQPVPCRTAAFARDFNLELSLRLEFVEGIRNAGTRHVEQLRELGDRALERSGVHQGTACVPMTTRD